MNAQSRLLVGYADELQDFRGILNEAQIELFISRMAALLAKHFPAPERSLPYEEAAEQVHAYYWSGPPKSDDIAAVAAILAGCFPAPEPLPAPQSDSSANCTAARPLPDLAPVQALIGAVQIITEPAMRETVVANWVYWSKQLTAKADAAEVALRAAQTPDSILNEMTFSKTV